MKQMSVFTSPMGGLTLRISLLIIILLVSFETQCQEPEDVPEPTDSIYFSASIPFDNSILADGYAYTLLACDGGLWT